MSVNSREGLVDPSSSYEQFGEFGKHVYSGDQYRVNV